MELSLNYGLFPNNEFLTFGLSVVAISDAHKGKLQILMPFCNKTSEKLNLLKLAMETPGNEKFTRKLEEKDATRKSRFLGFRHFTEACTFRPQTNDAAEILCSVIRRHGWGAHSMGLKLGTAAMSKIVSEIKNQNMAEIKSIKAEEWFNEFETAQREFEAVYNESMQVPATEKANVKTCRAELTTAIKNLFSMVSLLNSTTPSNELAALETAFGELITRSMTTVKASDTRAENQKKKGKMVTSNGSDVAKEEK